MKNNRATYFPSLLQKFYYCCCCFLKNISLTYTLVMETLGSSSKSLVNLQGKNYLVF